MPLCLLVKISPAICGQLPADVNIPYSAIGSVCLRCALYIGRCRYIRSCYVIYPRFDYSFRVTDGLFKSYFGDFGLLDVQILNKGDR